MWPDPAPETFRAWAPDGSRWSAWAKPVLFTYASNPGLPAAPQAERPPSSFRLDGVPSAGNGAAFVVELPGAAAVACGLALAGRGYRPVPLYNVTTGPGRDLVDVVPLMAALRDGASVLASLGLADDAPPAFLIDSQRLSGMPEPTVYDNRWMVFPQDFPSARALLAGGITRVIAIRDDRPLDADLRAVLRLWKREGLEVSAFDPQTGTASELSIDLSIWAVLADHVAAVFNGLRENSAGGFGGTVPTPGATGGGGFY